MTNEDQKLAWRWDALAEDTRVRALGHMFVRDLAVRVGRGWAASRGSERLWQFLITPGRRLVNLAGFGKPGLSGLCKIVESQTLPEREPMVIPEMHRIPEFRRILAEERTRRVPFREGVKAEAEKREREAAARQRSEAKVAMRTLEEWGVPPDFPCGLAGLPGRVLGDLEKRGIPDLGGLIDEWERLGTPGFASLRNLGGKSQAAVATFLASLVSGDRAVASRFLPLAPDGAGLSFAAALGHVLAGLSAKDSEILRLRLVRGLTLQKCGDTIGFHKERIRQIEAAFLGRIGDSLDHFGGLRTRMVSAWLGKEAWFALVGWSGSPGHAELAAAGVEKIFRNGSEGRARLLSEKAEARTRKSRFERLESELAALPGLWFGGVPSSVFLENHVKEADRQAFLSGLRCGTRFRLDESLGLIHPAKTALRKCLEAIVALHDTPVSLSRVLGLMRETGFHPGLERCDVIARRGGWKKQNGFPDSRILWRE